MSWVPELYLFTVDPALAIPAIEGGATGLVVDWERRGKEARQAGADTHVSADRPEDLDRMRAAVGAPILCRIDRAGPWTEDQLEDAFRRGATEVLLPMVRRAEEVERVLGYAAGRPVGILLETSEAVAAARELAALPLSRVYVGLNDLALARGSASIFAPLEDGLLDELRAAVGDVPFGFGGLTVPDATWPLPVTELIGHMRRLDADFTCLRRSFWADVAGRDPAAAVRAILRACRAG